MRAYALAAFLIGLPATAFAGGGFDIVVPGRPGVPIIINNIDASYSVVEGVWGLGKNVQVQPTIYGGRYVAERQPPTSAIITRAWVCSPAMAASKSSRPRTANCRSPPRAITRAGVRRPRRCRRKWMCRSTRRR